MLSGAKTKGLHLYNSLNIIYAALSKCFNISKCCAIESPTISLNSKSIERCSVICCCACKHFPESPASWLFFIGKQETGRQEEGRRDDFSVCTLCGISRQHRATMAQSLTSFDTWSTAILCLLRDTYMNSQCPLRGLAPAA